VQQVVDLEEVVEGLYSSLMYRFFFNFIFIIAAYQSSFSQTYEDVLRYNSYYHEGTSRFNSMGGAFGALGGDLSSININPAGSSVFINSDMALTIGLKNQEIKNDFQNSSSTSNNDNFTFNQIGFVLVYDNQKSKFSIAYNMNKLNDFNDSFAFSGQNSNGLDNYFLYYADGIPSSDLIVYEGESIQSVYKLLGDEYGFGDQQAFLGYQSYLINPKDSESNNYTSNAIYNNLNQSLFIERLGNHYKHSVNISSPINSNLFFGFNLNFHSIDFKEKKVFNESNYSIDSFVQKIQFEENLYVFGEGISFQLGALMKFNKLRLGLSYTTPTILEISEENSQYVESEIFEEDLFNTYKIDPNTINFYDEYKLILPSKSLLSFAYIFGSKGLISLDYEFTKYNNSKFDDDDGNDIYLNSLNDLVKNNLNGNSQSIRIGGEYRVKNYNLRSGYFYYKGPDSNNDNLISGFSLGLGIDYGYFNIDLSVTKSNDYYNNRLYSQGLTSSYSIDRDVINFSTTFTIKL